MPLLLSPQNGALAVDAVATEAVAVDAAVDAVSAVSAVAVNAVAVVANAVVADAICVNAVATDAVAGAISHVNRLTVIMVLLLTSRWWNVGLKPGRRQIIGRIVR